MVEASPPRRGSSRSERVDEPGGAGVRDRGLAADAAAEAHARPASPARSRRSLIARPEKVPLEVKKEVVVGRGEHVSRFRDESVQVHGAFVATLLVEAIVGGDDSFPVGSAQSAPGVVPVPATVLFVGVRTTAYVSGDPEAVLAGLDDRAV